MKFPFHILAAVLALLVAPTAAAETEVEGVQVTAILKPTRAEVTTLSPGVVQIEMWPIYGVFIGDPPEGVKILFSSDDLSGKGKVHLVFWHQLRYEKEHICFKEPGSNWNREPFCGTMQGSRAIITVNLGARRSEAFALVPVVIDHASGEILSFVSHPENTQMQVRCGEEENTISLFYVDSAGRVTIASEGQRATYRLRPVC